MDADAIPESEFSDYRKEPVVVQARQMEEDFTVETLEGTMEGAAGDYLIIGVEGERYPCDKEVFEQTYREAVDCYVNHDYVHSNYCPQCGEKV